MCFSIMCCYNSTVLAAIQMEIMQDSAVNSLKWLYIRLACPNALTSACTYSSDKSQQKLSNLWLAINLTDKIKIMSTKNVLGLVTKKWCSGITWNDIAQSQMQQHADKLMCNAKHTWQGLIYLFHIAKPTWLRYSLCSLHFLPKVWMVTSLSTPSSNNVFTMYFDVDWIRFLKQ